MNKKISVLLTFVLVLALAVPAFAAIEGEATSEVVIEEGEDGAETTVVLTDGEVVFAEMPADMELTSLFNVEMDDDNDLLFRVGPSFKYTAIENFTLGVIGDLDDDFMFQFGDQVDEGKTDDGEENFAIKFFADYEMVLAPGWTAGSENNIVIRDEEDDSLTINPFVKYELAVAEDMTTGFNADYELGDKEFEFDFDDTEFTFEPFFNLDTVLADNLTFTADNSLEFTHDGDDSETDLIISAHLKYTGVENFTMGITGAMDNDDYDDDELLVMPDFDGIHFAAKAYADYEVVLMPGVAVGSENSLTASKEANDGRDASDMIDNTELVIKPYVNYEMPLAQDTTFFTEASYELSTILDDIDFDGEYEVTVGVNYKF